jgi:cation transport ATPase
VREKEEKVQDEEAQAQEAQQEDEAQEEEVEVGFMKFGDELSQSRLSVSVHLIAAMIMGWASFTLKAVIYRGSETYSNWYAVFLGFAVLIGLGFTLERALGKKGVKWWLGNGGVVYVFVWVVAWVLLFNLYSA